MKSFLAFLRIIIVGILWGIVFTEGIRVIMLCNWHFDIFGKEHWQIFSELWHNGWAPHDGKEWALILLMVTFFPMIITGWWTLSLVAWEDIIWKIICWPYELYKKVFGKQTTATAITNNRYGIVKRKSYKQIRPAGISTLRIPISDYGTTAISSPMTSPATSALAGSSYAPATPAYASAPAEPVKKKTDVAATIDHALFKFDDDDDDFDLDIDSFEKADIKKKSSTAEKTKKKVFDDDDEDEDEKPTKSAKSYDFDDDEEEDDFEDEEEDRPIRKESRSSSKKAEDKEKRTTRTRNSESKESSRGERTTLRSTKRAESKDTEEASAIRSPVYETLSQKGYDVLTNIGIRDTLIDFVGVSENEICFCLVDKEAGDWLADEEMFNGEEPLWFSENSHRISPVCKLNSVRKIIEEKLDDEGFEQQLNFYVVVQMANIINADDMFEIWNNMKINVTRINRGAPKEIKLFSKQLTEVEDKLPKKSLDKLRNVLKNLK